MNEYKDIIGLKRPEISYKHPRMTIYNRSAIFAPFAALSGYKEEIIETERITDSKIELSDDLKNRINDKLINIKKNQEIDIEYFIKDNRKTGGKYIKRKGIVKKIDYIEKNIILFDKVIISFENIININ